VVAFIWQEYKAILLCGVRLWVNPPQAWPDCFAVAFIRREYRPVSIAAMCHWPPMKINVTVKEASGPAHIRLVASISWSLGQSFTIMCLSGYQINYFLNVYVSFINGTEWRT